MTDITAPRFDNAAHAHMQAGVRQGMLLGAIVSAIAVIGGHFVYPASVPVSDAVPDRLTCYIPYLALICAPLMVLICIAASQRYADPNLIAGATALPDPSFAQTQAMIQNTLEQMVLAVLVHLALLASLPYEWLNIVPVLAIWFIVGRIAFILGYRRGAAARSFGFAATFYPLVAGAIAVPILLVTRALA